MTNTEKREEERLNIFFREKYGWKRKRKRQIWKRLYSGARCSKAYHKWRMAVLKRDNYVCQECGIIGGKLHVHHIESFTYCPDTRYEVGNGKTLCISCHDIMHAGMLSRLV